MINYIKRITKEIKPAGLAKLSVYDVAIFFWKGLQEGAITTRASSLAFNFFLAFFPSTIVFFTLIPYIPIQNLQETLIDLLSIILPPSTHDIAFITLNDIISNPRIDLLSIGFILALYFSTNGINSLIEAFNASYHINESRPLLKQRLLSLGLTILLSAMLIIAIILIVFGKTTLNYLIYLQLISNSSAILLIYVKWATIIILLFSGITLLFNIGPSLKNKWQIFTPGAIFATTFIVTTCICFNFYINNFAQYNKIYGSIGTLMIILIWIYLNSIILLTGFELNASISNASVNKEKL